MAFEITENFGTYQGDTSYISDGNATNCWRADARQASGKYVQWAFDSEVTIATAMYSTTQTSEVFSSGAWLQVSSDGSTWEDIAEFDGSTSKMFQVGMECRYARIYCKSGSNYVSISEMEFAYGGSGGSGGGGQQRTDSFTPATFDSTHSYSSISNQNNPIGEGATSTSYAQVYLATGSRAQTNFAYLFDLSQIPSNAVIKSVTCQAKAYTNGTNSSRVTTSQVQLYSGSTAKGSPYNVAASTTPFNITAGTWTREELAQAKIRFNFVRGTSYTTTNYYIRFYGATLAVSYEIPEEGTAFRVNVAGEWKPVKRALVKSGGAWAEVDPNALADGSAVVRVD